MNAQIDNTKDKATSITGVEEKRLQENTPNAANNRIKEDTIDTEELEEKIQSFLQDLDELSAIKAKKVSDFKKHIEAFVEKRTTVLVTLKKLIE